MSDQNTNPTIIIIGDHNHFARLAMEAVAELDTMMMGYNVILKHVEGIAEPILDVEPMTLNIHAMVVPEKLPILLKDDLRHKTASFRSIPVPKKIGNGKGKKF